MATKENSNLNVISAPVGTDVNIPWDYPDSDQMVRVTWEYFDANGAATVILLHEFGNDAVVQNGFNIRHNTNGDVTITTVTVANSGTYRITVDYSTAIATDDVNVSVYDTTDAYAPTCVPSGEETQLSDVSVLPAQKAPVPSIRTTGKRQLWKQLRYVVAGPLREYVHVLEHAPGLPPVKSSSSIPNATKRTGNIAAQQAPPQKRYLEKYQPNTKEWVQHGANGLAYFFGGGLGAYAAEILKKKIEEGKDSSKDKKSEKGEEDKADRSKKEATDPDTCNGELGFLLKRISKDLPGLWNKDEISNKGEETKDVNSEKDSSREEKNEDVKSETGKGKKDEKSKKDSSREEKNEEVKSETGKGKKDEKSKKGEGNNDDESEKGKDDKDDNEKGSSTEEEDMNVNSETGHKDEDDNSKKGE